MARIPRGIVKQFRNMRVQMQEVEVNGIQMPATYVKGNTYYVDSNCSNPTDGKTPFTAFVTLAGALAVTTASQGDVVFVMPGHAETLASAAAVAMSTAGVSVVGLGVGSARPTFTFSTLTSATWTISAAGCSVFNIIGVCNIDQLVSPFVISAATVTLDIEWQDSAANKEAVTCVLGTAAADKLTVTLRYMGQTGGSHCVAPIQLNGTDEAVLNVSFYGKASTAVVNFITVASTGVRIYGDFYVSGTTDGSKNVVDTITGSTWLMDIFDGAAGARETGGSGLAVGSLNAVPAADATTNAYVRDVVGNKTDATVTAVGTTKSVLAYAKGVVNALVAAGGVASYPSSAAPANAVSLAAVLREIFDQQEKIISTITPAVMPLATTVTFTVAGGAIEIWQIISRCVTNNNGNAATLQWTWAGTLGTATTFTAASGSLASLVAGDLVITDLTLLSTAPLIMSTGIGAVLGSPTTQRYVITNGPGNVSAVVGTAATTGTWGHHMRYRPLGRGVSVTAAF